MPVTARDQSKLFYQSRLRRPMLDRAEGIYIWDRNGKRYLDGSSGAMVCNIGHSNPPCAGRDEAADGYARPSATGCISRPSRPRRWRAMIAALAPEGLDRVFFVSGGSEAVESCSETRPPVCAGDGQAQRWKVISRYPSYHGSTLGALSVTGYAPLSAPFAPMMVRDAEDPGAARLSRRSRPRRPGDRPPLCRHAGGADPGRRPADRARPSSRSRSAARRPGRWCRRPGTWPADPRDLRPLRRLADP